MKCQRCGEESAVVLAEDSIKCKDCGKEQFIQFWFCPCGYNFRTNGGEIFDGWEVSPTSVEMSGEELASLIQDLSEEKEEETSLLVSYVRQCVKCNSVATYESKHGVYTCSDCGFEWEILKHE